MGDILVIKPADSCFYQRDYYESSYLSFYMCFFIKCSEQSSKWETINDHYALTFHDSYGKIWPLSSIASKLIFSFYIILKLRKATAGKSRGCPTVMGRLIGIAGD